MGLALAAMVGFHLHKANQSEKIARFEALTKRVISSLTTQLNIYEYGLRGARGAVIAAGSEDITWEKFHRYSLSRNIGKEFPGSRGYGFVRRVVPEQESEFLQAAQHDGRPDFMIKQLKPHDGERFVIQYIEPEAANRPAIGLDIASEPKDYRTKPERRKVRQAANCAHPGGVWFIFIYFQTDTKSFRPCLGRLSLAHVIGWDHFSTILIEDCIVRIAELARRYGGARVAVYRRDQARLDPGYAYAQQLAHPRHADRSGGDANAGYHRCGFLPLLLHCPSRCFCL